MSETRISFASDFTLVNVAAGEFLMGDSEQDNGPEHTVSLSQYIISRRPVSQRLWQVVMGSNPSYFKGEQRPVENVSWNDAQEFTKRLNSREDVRSYIDCLDCAGKVFRLPTEAEWENAMSAEYLAHSQCRDYYGPEMSPYVWEWCSDWWSEDYYAECLKQGVAADPIGPGVGEYKVIRGNCNINMWAYCKPVYRYNNIPRYADKSVGFRLVLA